MELATSTAFAAGEREAVPEQISRVPTLGMFAVADATGGADGHAGARLVLELVRTHIERNKDLLGRFRRHPTAELRALILERLQEAFARAGQELFAFARRRPAVRVTLDVLLLLGSEAFIGHLGDGRVYLVRRGVVHQLTVDHSRGDEVLQLGDAPSVPGPGRALGPAPTVAIESLCMEAAQDDRFVVCGASLVAAVSEPQLHARFTAEPVDRLPERLVADAGGAPVLAVCAQLGGGAPFTADLARARLAVLAPMPLFAHCTERELRIVAQATHPRRLPAGAVIFEEGQPGNDLYLLISGSVAVLKGGRPIATLPPGSVFGEMAMLDEPVRSATARTAEAAELMVIKREAFFPMLRAHPPLAVKILWNLNLRLSASLRHTSERVAALEAELAGTLSDLPESA
jgi:PPM family protein phosphatase